MNFYKIVKGCLENDLKDIVTKTGKWVQTKSQIAKLILAQVEAKPSLAEMDMPSIADPTTRESIKTVALLSIEP